MDRRGERRLGTGSVLVGRIRSIGVSAQRRVYDFRRKKLHRQNSRRPAKRRLDLSVYEGRTGRVRRMGAVSYPESAHRVL